MSFLGGVLSVLVTLFQLSGGTFESFQSNIKAWGDAQEGRRIEAEIQLLKEQKVFYEAEMERLRLQKELIPIQVEAEKELLEKERKEDIKRGRAESRGRIYKGVGKLFNTILYGEE